MALCEDNPTLPVNSIIPSAVSLTSSAFNGPHLIFAQYQIRFLGCKGVVSVDLKLEGIHMCIRPSMSKFEIPGEEYGTIEIARSVGKPNIPHLNRFVSIIVCIVMYIFSAHLFADRPLVMVLEDRGAPKEVFMKLQEDAVANARMAHDSAALYAQLLESRRLCYSYRLAAILRRLNTLGLELKPNHLQQPLDTPFLAKLRACAINHVLREVKHDARIPIPNSYMLVGVADEGPAYVEKGLKGVYCLPQGKIFGMCSMRSLKIIA